MMDSDYELARKLQEEELKRQTPEVQIITNKENYRPAPELNSTQNLVHPEWETIDPTPNIHILKDQYDRKFFQGKLGPVELEWSKQMYKCAGICYQRSNRLGMKACTIRLSEPLLKLRSRKDLVETLLHEMIHAYLFVLNIREGNGGHGPNFKRIMEGINRQAGTNISVYHTFHDEVRVYEKHWWRCNGPCQNRKPFYGYVKRCVNRAPGRYDFWFAQHQRDCGGTFIKIKEPTPKKKEPKGSSQNKTNQQSNKISNYVQKGGTGGGNTTLNRGGGTLVFTKPPQTKTPVPSENKTVNPKTGQNIHTIKSPPMPTVPQTKPANIPSSNIVGFKDLGQNNGTISKPIPHSSFAAAGHTLGGSTNKRSRLLDEFEASSSKKQKSDSSNSSSILLDDDQDDVLLAVDLDEIERQNDTTLTQADKAKARQTIIKQEIFDSHGFSDEDNIIIIDDEYDDELEGAAGDNLNLSKEVIDDLFSDDMLGNQDKKTIPCPICDKRFSQSSQKAHIEQCYEDLLKACDVGSHLPKPGSSSVVIKEEKKTSQQKTEPDVIVLPEEGDLVQCPVCPRLIPSDKINDHLDTCLANSFSSDF